MVMGASSFTHDGRNDFQIIQLTGETARLFLLPLRGQGLLIVYSNLRSALVIEIRACAQGLTAASIVGSAHWGHEQSAKPFVLRKLAEVPSIEPD
jgi:hypothetical protein